MESKAKKAITTIRDTIDRECEDLPPGEFKEVLEEIEADIQGHLEALKDEAED